MGVSSLSRVPAQVVVAGGGFAALEAVLALRALAGDGVRVTLVSPDPALAYDPAATVEVFAPAPARAYDLRAIAADLGVSYHHARLETVASQKRRVRLGSGAGLRYDALVLATGARATVGVPGALTFRDQRDVPRFQGLLRELDAGAVAHLVFAVPSGCSWPLPLYELALLSAAYAHEHGVETEIKLVSSERRPLAVFGADASGLVAAELAERGVRFIGSSAAGSVRREGSLALQFDAAIEGDRVVAAPRLRGQPISGVPASRLGFVPTDAAGRVEGMVDVYAAGDMTTFPIKQGGLATQQADRIAHTIAAGLGLTARELRAKRVLEVRLVGGQRPLLLRIELDEFGQPTTATLAHVGSERAPGWTKVFGRYLTPYLETRQPLARSPLDAS